MPRLHITYIARGFVNPNGNNNNDEIGEEMLERSQVNFDNPSELQQLLIDDYERKIVPLYRPILTPDWQEDLESVEFNFDDFGDAYADIIIENWRLLRQIDFRPNEPQWTINNFLNNGNNARTATPSNSPISMRSRAPSTFSVMSDTGFKGGKLRKSRKRRSKRRSKRRYSLKHRRR